MAEKPNINSLFNGTSRMKSQRMRRFAESLQWRQSQQKNEFYEYEMENSFRFRLKQIDNGEMKGLGTGTFVWPAAHVLGKYLETNYFNGSPNSLVGKKVCEIGSGTGLTGLVAALLGGSVALTDQICLKFLMEENIQLVQEDYQKWCDSPSSSTPSTNTSLTDLSISLFHYDWGEEPSSLLSLAPFDIVLVSDCVLPKLYPIEPLVKAVRCLMGPNSLALFSYEHRPYPLYDPRDEFIRLCSLHSLSVRSLPLSSHHPRFSCEDIEVWEVRLINQLPLPPPPIPSPSSSSTPSSLEQLTNNQTERDERRGGEEKGRVQGDRELEVVDPSLLTSPSPSLSLSLSHRPLLFNNWGSSHPSISLSLSLPLSLPIPHPSPPSPLPPSPLLLLLPPPSLNLSIHQRTNHSSSSSPSPSTSPSPCLSPSPPPSPCSQLVGSFLWPSSLLASWCLLCLPPLLLSPSPFDLTLPTSQPYSPPPSSSSSSSSSSSTTSHPSSSLPLYPLSSLLSPSPSPSSSSSSFSSSFPSFSPFSSYLVLDLGAGCGLTSIIAHSLPSLFSVGREGRTEKEGEGEGRMGWDVLTVDRGEVRGLLERNCQDYLRAREDWERKIRKEELGKDGERETGEGEGEGRVGGKREGGERGGYLVSMDFDWVKAIQETEEGKEEEEEDLKSEGMSGDSEMNTGRGGGFDDVFEKIREMREKRRINSDHSSSSSSPLPSPLPCSSLPDLIILSDCCYDSLSSSPLFSSLRRLSGPHTLFLLSNEWGSGLDLFLSTCHRGKEIDDKGGGEGEGEEEEGRKGRRKEVHRIIFQDISINNSQLYRELGVTKINNTPSSSYSSSTSPLLSTSVRLMLGRRTKEE